ncbi:MAG: hypothetical protein ABUT20_37525 [Bacteroidota bacterium]
MKKLLLSFCMCLLLHSIQAQVSYYKGEWRKGDKGDLFECFCRIEIKNKIVTGKLIWTYMAADSADSFMVDFYKGKKGKKAVEYVNGAFNPSTNDMSFEGGKLTDPSFIFVVDKYQLKLSTNKQVLYGRSSNNDANNGFFYAMKLTTPGIDKEFERSLSSVN